MQGFNVFMLINFAASRFYRMNFFEKKSTWTNLEFIPLKLCIASIYLLLGVWLADYVRHIQGFLFVLFFVCLTLSLHLWFKKMSKEN